MEYAKPIYRDGQLVFDPKTATDEERETVLQLVDDTYLETIIASRGDISQAFWDAFSSAYPPASWDEHFATLAAAVPAWMSQAVGEAGVDLAVYMPGNIYPGGRRCPENTIELWASGDGYFLEAKRLAEPPADMDDDAVAEAFAAGALQQFGDAIARDVLAELPALDVAAFFIACQAYWDGERETALQ